jgi:aryl carrier-like protein
MAPLPVGIPGELYLGGVQLARAYGGRPGLTAGRFVADPLSVPGARLYRTGDLARWRPDGVLEYLGRADRQVKVRGFRVEPGEIEAALVSQPGVAQAVVTVREDQPGERRIIAYLTAAPAPAAGARTALLPEPAALRAGLARTLPDHMIPAAFVPLPALPLDPNGKVDYPALPAPPPGPAGRTTPYIAPRTAAERQIAALWREVLNRDRVGVTDNFFELGGDSMHAIRITGLAREQGLDITSAELFTHQTVEAMAASLAARADPAEPCAQPPPVAAFGLLAPSDLARLQVP